MTGLAAFFHPWGKAYRVLLTDLSEIITVPDQGAVTAGFWLEDDGNIYRQYSTQAPGPNKVLEAPWLYRGTVAQYQVRFTVTKGTVSTPRPTTWEDIGSDIFMAVQLAANTPGTKDAEVLVEIRDKATQVVLTSGKWYMRAGRDPNAVGGLGRFTVRGIGSGGGSKAAIVTLGFNAATASVTAQYTDASNTLISAQLGSTVFNGITPDGIMVSASKIEGGGSMFNKNPGLNKILAWTGGTIHLWEVREPDAGQQKTVIFNVTFYKGTEPLYNTQIRIEADARAGAANPGVTTPPPAIS